MKLWSTNSVEVEPLRWFYLHVLDAGTDDEIMLYAGRSMDIDNRQSNHERSKPYFDRLPGRVAIVPQQFELGTTSRQVGNYERRFIESNRPPWNVKHNPDYEMQQVLRDEILGLDSGLSDRLVHHRWLIEQQFAEWRPPVTWVVGLLAGGWVGGWLVAALMFGVFLT